MNKMEYKDYVGKYFKGECEYATYIKVTYSYEDQVISFLRFISIGSSRGMLVINPDDMEVCDFDRN